PSPEPSPLPPSPEPSPLPPSPEPSPLPPSPVVMVSVIFGGVNLPSNLTSSLSLMQAFKTDLCAQLVAVTGAAGCTVLSVSRGSVLTTVAELRPLVPADWSMLVTTVEQVLRNIAAGAPTPAPMANAQPVLPPQCLPARLLPQPRPSLLSLPPPPCPPAALRGLMSSPAPPPSPLPPPTAFVPSNGLFNVSASAPGTYSPRVTLYGSADVRLQLFDTYQEQGAYAMDDTDGRVPAVTVPLDPPVNTSTTSPLGLPYLVSYTATDAAGNTAVTIRRVTVVDDCPLPEHRCSMTLACSVYGTCALSAVLLGADGGELLIGKFRPEAVPRVRPADSMPPHISLHAGDGGTTFLDPSGTDTGAETRVLSYATVSVPYQDPGFTAEDEQDGFGGGPPSILDVTARVLSSVWPDGRVDTSRPTRPERPYRIIYTARDPSLLPAPVAVRLVVVRCPGTEVPCTDPDDPSGPYSGCSVQGVCASDTAPVLPEGVAAALPAGPDQAGTTSGAGDPGGPLLILPGWSGVVGSTRTLSTAAYWAAALSGPLVPEPPLLQLNGPETAYVQQHASYMYGCVDDDGCDEGATASTDHTSYGDLYGLIVACTEGIEHPEPLANVGLLYCNIDTSSVQTYNITYSLAYGGYLLSVTRLLVVLAQCPGGVRRCKDGACAAGDYVCPATDFPPAALAGIPSSNDRPDSAGTPLPPSLVLRLSPVLGPSVSVRQGVPYKLCAPGQPPTVDLPCELGAAAADLSGNDLSSRVVLCPPAGCERSGCLLHAPAIKTVADCGIVTATADIGTVFKLVLAVYDSRDANATVERTITVIAPCDEGLYLCGGGCHSVTCVVRAALLQVQEDKLAAGQPKVVLLPGNSKAGNTSGNGTDGLSLTLTYGQAAPLSLAPCATFAAGLAGSCAAMALDSSGGDLSVDLTATDVSPCSSSAGSCYRCSPYDLTVGTCLPGRYTMRYRVVDADGRSAQADLQVAVEQRAVVTVGGGLVFGDAAQASAFVQQLDGNDTGRLATVLQLAPYYQIEAGSMRDTALHGALEVGMAGASSTMGGVIVSYSIDLTIGCAERPSLSGSDADVSDGDGAGGLTSGAQRQQRRLLALLATSTGSSGGDGRTAGPAAEASEAAALAGDTSDEWDEEGADEGDERSNGGGEFATLASMWRTTADDDAQLARQVAARWGGIHEHALNGLAFAERRLHHASQRLSLSLRHPAERLLQESPGIMALAASGTSCCMSTLHDPSLEPLLKGAAAAAAPAGASLRALSPPHVTCLSAPTDPAALQLAAISGALVESNDALAAMTDARAAQEDANKAASVYGAFLSGDQRYAAALMSLSTAASDGFEATLRRLGPVEDNGAREVPVQEAAQAAVGLLMQAVLSELADVAQSARVTAGASAEAFTMGTDGDGSAVSAAAREVFLACLTGRVGSAAKFHFKIASAAGGGARSNGVGTRPPRPPTVPLPLLDAAALSGPQRRAVLQWQRPGESAADVRAATGSRGGGALGSGKSRQLVGATSGGGSSGGSGASGGRGNSSSQPGSVGGNSGLPLHEPSLGYQVVTPSYDTGRTAYSNFSRYVGSHRSNEALGGLLLHQTRRSSGSASTTASNGGDGSCSSRFASLAAACSGLAGGSQAGVLNGIGTDPVFKRQSSLYRPDLYISDFYNTSAAATVPAVQAAEPGAAAAAQAQLAAGGMPYGFFHAPLPGFQDGYPLVVDTALGAKRAAEIVAYLRDGAYLSASRTSTLSAHLVTLNPALSVLGYLRLDLVWRGDGRIPGRLAFSGMPTLPYSKGGLAGATATQLLTDIALLSLVILYLVLAVIDLVAGVWMHRPGVTDPEPASPEHPGLPQHLASLYLGQAAGDCEPSRGSTTTRAAGPTDANLLLQALTLGLMIAALAVYGVYGFQISSTATFAQRYDIYDAPDSAPARFFMLRRREMPPPADAAPLPSPPLSPPSTRAGGPADPVFSPTSPPPSPSAPPPALPASSYSGLPGEEGRWALPEDRSGLTAAGDMVGRVNRMSTYLTVYGMLQGCVLMCLILQWLGHMSFQPRLSVIPGTLLLSLPQLAHIALALVIIGIMLAAALSLTFGSRVEGVSGFPAALRTALDLAFHRWGSCGTSMHDPMRATLREARATSPGPVEVPAVKRAATGEPPSPEDETKGPKRGGASEREGPLPPTMADRMRERDKVIGRPSSARGDGPPQGQSALPSPSRARLKQRSEAAGRQLEPSAASCVLEPPLAQATPPSRRVMRRLMGNFRTPRSEWFAGLAVSEEQASAGGPASFQLLALGLRLFLFMTARPPASQVWLAPASPDRKTQPPRPITARLSARGVPLPPPLMNQLVPHDMHRSMLHFQPPRLEGAATVTIEIESSDAETPRYPTAAATITFAMPPALGAAVAATTAGSTSRSTRGCLVGRRPDAAGIATTVFIPNPIFESRGAACSAGTPCPPLPPDADRPQQSVPAPGGSAAANSTAELASAQAIARSLRRLAWRLGVASEGGLGTPGSGTSLAAAAVHSSGSGGGWPNRETLAVGATDRLIVCLKKARKQHARWLYETCGVLLATPVPPLPPPMPPPFFPTRSAAAVWYAAAAVTLDACRNMAPEIDGGLAPPKVPHVSVLLEDRASPPPRAWLASKRAAKLGSLARVGCTHGGRGGGGAGGAGGAGSASPAASRAHDERPATSDSASLQVADVLPLVLSRLDQATAMAAELRAVQRLQAQRVARVAQLTEEVSRTTMQGRRALLQRALELGVFS
ncbi:hypothetical protein TSOC_007762, partial [Tetrabaena socialis]